MTNATFRQPSTLLPVTRLRLGRVVLLLLVGATVLGGGAVWLLRTQGHALVAPITDSAAWPPWLKQAQTYPAPEAQPFQYLPVFCTVLPPIE